MPRDLETVVLKAIARDPAQRDQTPAEMAEDLKRFVEDHPFAPDVSETEKAWRRCRRNPLPASLLAGIVLVFLIGFAGVFWQWRVAENAGEDEKNQRGRAERYSKARKSARRSEEARGRSGRCPGRSNRPATPPPGRRPGCCSIGGSRTPAAASRPGTLHLFVRSLWTLPAEDPEAVPLERVIRMNLTAWAETVPALEHIWPGGPRFEDVVFTPDGELVVMAVGKDEIQCFRTRAGGPAGPPFKVSVGIGTGMKFAPDGRSLWVASPGRRQFVEQGFIHRFDPASGRPIQTPIPTAGPVVRLAVTPNGRYLVGAVWGCTRMTGVARMTRIEPANGARRRSWCGRRRRAGLSERWR